MKKLIRLLVLLMVMPLASQSIEKFSIDSGGASASTDGIQILYTIGEVNVQEASAGGISISEGFINSLKLEIKITPTVFLQGPYNSSALSDDLRTSGLIPTTSPYLDALTCDASVFTVSGANAIIDWVWLEIRAADMTTVVSSRSALLQSDGDVVNVDGVAPIVVDIPDGDYYFMISHRNHLGVISASTYGLSRGSATAIDLTADSSLINGGLNGISDMGDGNFALYSGDFNGDGQIQNSDRIAVQTALGLSGLLNADIDMNTQVQNIDIQNKLSPNIGKGEQFANRGIDLKLFAKTSKTNKD